MRTKVWCAHILHTEMDAVLKLRIIGPDDPERLVALIETAIKDKWYSDHVHLLYVHEQEPEERAIGVADTAIENMIFQGMAVVHGLLFVMHYIVEKRREAGEL